MVKYQNIKLTLNDVRDVYEKIKALSQRQIDAGNYEVALGIIETAAKTAYYFNWIYTDEELEAQLRIISEGLIHADPLIPEKGRIVFYDSWGWDNRGLTQQYIRALKALDIEFLFVFENESLKQSTAIRSELEAYRKCEIYSINQSLPLWDRLEGLYRRIREYRPEKLMMHITPWAVEALTVFYALTTVIKYQINLTDHAFWLGAGCLDYSLEFRSYGCTVSLEKRKLKRNQLLMNPYYPITSDEAFQGFPKEADKKMVLFSGSSFYKVYGRNDLYFRLMKRLLVENPECVLLFAGGGDGRKIRKFIVENQLENRFLLLGPRPDINEVFTRCDIYVGTYPIAGGLMSQLAALNSKPILSYTTPDIPCNYIEEIICHKQSISISFTEEQAFFAEARKLVQNDEFRRQRGESLRAAIILPDDFKNNLDMLLKTNKNLIEFKHIGIDYDCFTTLFLEVENDYLDSFKRLLLKAFRSRLPFLFPVVFLKICFTFFSQKISLLKKVY